jgi:hypothetical protein
MRACALSLSALYLRALFPLPSNPLKKKKEKRKKKKPVVAPPGTHTGVNYIEIYIGKRLGPPPIVIDVRHRSGLYLFGNRTEGRRS